MENIFHSSKLRFSRAKEHIIALEQNIRFFFATNKYSSIIERDPTGLKLLHKIRLKNRFPDKFSVIAADAINNLRSALDHGWYAIAVASHAISTDKEAYFPFADSAIKLESKINRGCKYFPQEILSLLRAFKPYKGGDDLLWALNRICAFDKHRLLCPTTVFTNISFPLIECVGTGDATVYAPKWNRRNNEIIYFISDLRNIVKYKINLSFDVTFDKVEIIGGQPAITTLNALADKVKNILKALERISRKLGYF